MQLNGLPILLNYYVQVWTPHSQSYHQSYNQVNQPIPKSSESQETPPMTKREPNLKTNSAQSFLDLAAAFSKMILIFQLEISTGPFVWGW